MVKTRIIHKRDKIEARNAAFLLMSMSFGLCLVEPELFADLAPAAFASGVMAIAASRRSLLAEFHFRKHYSRRPFDWGSWSDAKCQDSLHMRRVHVDQLLDLFVVPALSNHPRWNADLRCFFSLNKCRFSVQEVLVTVLARFRSADHWSHVAQILGGRHESAYKILFNEVVCLLHSFWFDRLMDMRPWAQECVVWARAIHRKTQASPRCIGMLDGTFIEIPKPTGDLVQRQMYNRYYRGHGIKFQSVVVPNGLLFNLHGPNAGKYPDSKILGKSGLMDQMAELSELAGTHYVLYADCAYGLEPHLLRGLKRNMIRNREAQEYQSAMNSPRTSVEWGFGEVAQDWPWLRRKTLQKVLLSPVAVFWQMAAVLSNVKTCLKRGNVITDFFGLRPPTIARYLALE